MALVSFSANTKILSADVNANFTGVTNWSLLSDSSVVLQNFISSGGIIAVSSGLIGTFSNINYFIGGQRYSATSIANKTYTASKDTYVDINTSGTVTYTEVANNAASAALTASNIRVAIIVSNGTNLTVINQGSPGTTGPTVSSSILSVTDTIGNLIYPSTAVPGLIGYRQITTSFSTALQVATQVTGLSAPVIIPAGNRRVRVTVWTPTVSANGALTSTVGIWDGTVGSGTQLTIQQNIYPASTSAAGATAIAWVLPAAGSKTYNADFHVSANTGTFTAGGTFPAFISVELE